MNWYGGRDEFPDWMERQATTGKAYEPLGETCLACDGDETLTDASICDECEEKQTGGRSDANKAR